MKLAVASGKGGTGKTTVAVSLALCATGNVQYMDCDVEEPNGHLFLKPQITERITCKVTVPVINEEKCTYCGKCRDICRFNAITVFGKTIMAFPELCHACRGCFLVCDEKAIDEGEREVGVVEKGSAGSISFCHGKLRIGEAMSPPLIKAVKKHIIKDALVILDAPPGTTCPVIATVKDADYVILVTEPTPFGLNDLKLAVGVLRKLDIPFSVIINRHGIGDDRVERWCAEEGIDIKMRIPFDRKIAEGYAKAQPLVETRTDLRASFEQLLEEIRQ